MQCSRRLVVFGRVYRFSHAVVEDFVIVAAGSVVLEKTICESGYLYAGIPAKKIKPLTAEQIEMHELFYSKGYIRFISGCDTFFIRNGFLCLELAEIIRAFRGPLLSENVGNI